jgi:hypothetical protein
MLVTSSLLLPKQRQCKEATATPVRFQILTGEYEDDIAPCSLIEVDRHFGGAYFIIRAMVGVNRLGYEADHLLPFSAEVKNVWMFYLHSFICPYDVVLH